MTEWEHPMRNAICLAESLSTSYFCLRNAAFLNEGVVQSENIIVHLREESDVVQGNVWSTILRRSLA